MNWDQDCETINGTSGHHVGGGWVGRWKTNKGSVSCCTFPSLVSPPISAACSLSCLIMDCSLSLLGLQDCHGDVSSIVKWWDIEPPSTPLPSCLVFLCLEPVENCLGGGGLVATEKHRSHWQHATLSQSWLMWFGCWIAEIWVTLCLPVHRKRGRAEGTIFVFVLSLLSTNRDERGTVLP